MRTGGAGGCGGGGGYGLGGLCVPCPIQPPPPSSSPQPRWPVCHRGFDIPPPRLSHRRRLSLHTFPQSHIRQVRAAVLGADTIFKLVRTARGVRITEPRQTRPAGRCRTACRDIAIDGATDLQLVCAPGRVRPAGPVAAGAKRPGLACAPVLLQTGGGAAEGGGAGTRPPPGVAAPPRRTGAGRRAGRRQAPAPIMRTGA